MRATAEIECAGDAKAIKEAHNAHVPFTGFGFNIWQAERLASQHRAWRSGS